MSRDFGIYPDNESPKLWWGARGIIRYYGNSLDIPWDRQSHEFADGEDKDDFIYWIDKTAIPKLEECVKYRDTRKVSFDSDSGRFHCEAEDRNSGGYLYIGAWSREG